MSNFIKAYGWIGHILVLKDEETLGRSEENIIAIDPDKFQRLLSDHEEDRLDKRICIQKLGITCSEKPVSIMASGTHFSEGFHFYGTVINVLDDFEDEAGEKVKLDVLRAQVAYISGMKEIYSIDLQSSRFMVGCSSET